MLCKCSRGSVPMLAVAVWSLAYTLLPCLCGHYAVVLSCFVSAALRAEPMDDCLSGAWLPVCALGTADGRVPSTVPHWR